MSGAEHHEQIEADFSEYWEKTLPPARMKEIDEHLAGCERCRAELEKFREAMNALSGLHKMAAPVDMTERVASTIHRRSAGRFFGRKAFGDRLPYEVLAVVALAICVGVVLLIRWSATGAIHEPLRRQEAPPTIDPGVKDLVRPPPAAAPSGSAVQGPVPLAAGAPAPDFEVTAHDGTHVKLSALKGKPIVLYFYPKDDTPG
jgi:anti-sigma factor RsiW